MKAIDALKIAREALKERRAYCKQLEYKYCAEWDNEDGYIQDAIDKLAEPEKTAEDYDISEAASDIFSNADGWFINYNKIKQIIQKCAESYHAKKCSECKKARLTD